MATHGRGLICLCLTEERCEELGLPPMTEQNEAPLGTAFTNSIEAREGVTTGISAPDRAQTIQVAIIRRRRRTTSSSRGTSFRCARGPAACSTAPARPRPRSTSPASPGSNPAGVICEIMNDDGTMARVPDLVAYCEQHEMRMVTVADLIEYRRRRRSSSSARVGLAADRVRRLHGHRVPRDAHRQAATSHS